jgi:hypothetical protein
MPDVPLLFVAVAALAGTVLYLWSGGVETVLVGGVLAALVLFVPLLWSRPASRKSRGRVALVWVIGGILGGYMFGTAVLAAAVPAALLSLAIRATSSSRSLTFAVLGGLGSAASVVLFIGFVGGPSPDPLVGTLYWCGLPLLAWGGCGYLCRRMGYKAFGVAVWLGGSGTAALAALPVAFSLSMGQSDL